MWCLLEESGKPRRQVNLVSCCSPPSNILLGWLLREMLTRASPKLPGHFCWWRNYRLRYLSSGESARSRR